MQFAKKEKVTRVDRLSKLTKKDELFESLVTLQNEINVGHDTKVIAVTSIENDLLSASLAKALALTYSFNDSKTLIIDANMFNPSLEKVLDDSEEVNISILNQGDENLSIRHQTTSINENLDAVCFVKETYPGNVFKSQIIQKMIENEGQYEHFIIIVPSIKEHKEIELLREVVQSIVLVVQKSVTKKKDIYEAIAFCQTRQLPLAKTVIVE